MNMLLLRHVGERIHVGILLVLVRQIRGGTRFDELDVCCWNGPFHRFHLFQDAEHWWRNPDFEMHQR